MIDGMDVAKCSDKRKSGGRVAERNPRYFRPRGRIEEMNSCVPGGERSWNPVLPTSDTHNSIEQRIAAVHLFGEWL